MKFILTFDKERVGLKGGSTVNEGPNLLDGYVEVYALDEDSAQRAVFDAFGTVGLALHPDGELDLDSLYPVGPIGVFDTTMTPRVWLPAPHGMVPCPDCGGSGDLNYRELWGPREFEINPCPTCAVGRRRVPRPNEA